LPYVPTAQDALGAYIAALAHWHNVPVTEVNWPKSNRIKQLLLGIFTIYTKSGEFIIVLYDNQSDLWNVRLADGTIVSVRKTGQDNGAIFIVE
jgi:hypothetical protein